MKTRKELLQRAEDLLYISGGETTMLVVATANGLIALARELREGAAPAAPAARPAAAPAVGGAVFPPYGHSKGLAVAGATMGDLEFYANGCKRTLNDPAKSRWHDKERELLAAIEAEIARQGGSPAQGDFGAPPPGFDGRSEPPPPDDLEIPF